MADPVTEFEKYREELLALLNGDDPIMVLRETLHELPKLLEGASEEQLRRQPAPGEWSPREVLTHLADSDLVHSVRMRMIITQDRPLLVGYDQEAWATRFGSLDPTARDVAERWRVLRRANLLMYESITEQELDRVGLHSERGEESVRLNIRLLAGHDRTHLDQFRRGLQHS